MSQQNSQKYVVVHFFDNQIDGFNFPSSEWPLHITLLSNFSLKWPREALVKKLDEIARSSEPFGVTTAGDDMFGADHTVPVTLIKPDESLMALHNKLNDMATDALAYFDSPQYLGKAYRPHATVQRGFKLDKKAMYGVGNFSLVDMFPKGDISRREVIKT